MEQPRVLLLDAAPGELLDRELERLVGHGLAWRWRDGLRRWA